MKSTFKITFIFFFLLSLHLPFFAIASEDTVSLQKAKPLASNVKTQSVRSTLDPGPDYETIKKKIKSLNDKYLKISTQLDGVKKYYDKPLNRKILNIYLNKKNNNISVNKLELFFDDQLVHTHFYTKTENRLMDSKDIFVLYRTDITKGDHTLRYRVSGNSRLVPESFYTLEETLNLSFKKNRVKTVTLSLDEINNRPVLNILTHTKKDYMDRLGE